MRPVVFPLLFAAVLLPAPLSSGQDKTKDEPRETTEYYPLKKGTTWTYEADGKTTYTVTVVDFKKVGEEPCAHLVCKIDGKETASEDVTVKKDGVYRCAYAGSDVKPPYQFLKLPIKPGDKRKVEWKVDSKVSGQEIKGDFVLGEEKGVKVKAGVYDTVTATSTSTSKIDGQASSVTYYFAPKVGLVKSVVEIGGVKVVSELVKFEETKK